ncbi:cell-to-cell transport protein [Horseradish latent virus]|uniref:Movement protein n=1 Tax=Horseradish latent virus TaxID=264076 RepID=Q5J1S5_9VIRU|nr:cell-to-cell transport protein [Horseradish latent virus]AAW56085.1 cell-to-cell transport protein [Horseradish latent virus]
MDLYPTKEEDTPQNQTEKYVFSKEDSSGYSAELMVNNDLLKTISKTKLTLEKEKVFRMTNPLTSMVKSLCQRKNHIFYCVTTKELSIDICESSGKVYLPLLTNEEINGRLTKVDPRIRQTLSIVHIGAVKILLKAQFRNGINSPVKLALIDDRINDRKDCLLGAARGNLNYGKFMFTVYPKFGVSLRTKRLNQTLSFIHEFERNNLMNKGDKVMTITYLVAYALTNSHHSIDYKSSSNIELEDVFQEIGNVEQSEFCIIENEDCNWAIDIAQNKAELGKTKKLISDNQLKIESGESSNGELHRLNESVNKLREKFVEICG